MRTHLPKPYVSQLLKSIEIDKQHKLKEKYIMKTITINDVQISEEDLLAAGYAPISKTKPIKKGRWKPGFGDIYWRISASGILNQDIWDAHPIDIHRFARGNVFKTESEAELVNNKMVAKQAVIDKLRELERKEIDWSNSTQRKYFFSYDHHTHKFKIDWYVLTQYPESILYTTSEEAIAWVLENMQAELKLIFGVS